MTFASQPAEYDAACGVFPVVPGVYGAVLPRLAAEAMARVEEFPEEDELPVKHSLVAV